jgi:uncharacterized protein (DUF736 family)
MADPYRREERPPAQSGDRQWPTIGHVAKQIDGSYKGRLTTLSLQCEIKLAPNTQKAKAEQPDFRVFGRKDSRSIPVEIGAAWVRINREGDEYVSLSISAPELGRRIFANLGKVPGQDDDVFALIWNDSGAAPATSTAAGSDGDW